MKSFLAPVATALAACTLLGACAGPGYDPYGTQPQPTTRTSYPANNNPYQVSYGVVESIQMTQAAPAQQGVGAGAVIGGVVGGVLGNQVGGGSGRKLATIAGAIGGAVAGHEIQKQRGGAQYNQYQVVIRLDNGTYQTVLRDHVDDLQVGNRVRIENNAVYRY